MRTDADLERLMRNVMRTDPNFSKIGGIVRRLEAPATIFGSGLTQILARRLYGTAAPSSIKILLDEPQELRQTTRGVMSPGPAEDAFYERIGRTINAEGRTYWTVSRDLWTRRTSPTGESMFRAMVFSPEDASAHRRIVERMPFSFDAIGYDVREERLYGTVGVTALLDRRIVVLDAPTALQSLKKQEREPEEYLQDVATELGFTLDGCYCEPCLLQASVRDGPEARI